MSEIQLKKLIYKEVFSKSFKDISKFAFISEKTNEQNNVLILFICSLVGNTMLIRSETDQKRVNIL